MEILHIMSLNERNGYNFFQQLHDAFDLTDHRFIVMRGEGALRSFPKFKEFDCLEFLPKKRNKKSILGKLKRFFFLRRRMRQADAIIFHSLLFLNTDYIYVFALSKRLLKKSAWVEWGADLYNWRYEPTSLKKRLMNYANERIRKNVSWVGMTFDGDYEEYEKQFPDSKVKFFSAPLPFDYERGLQLERNRPQNPVRSFPDAPLRVQVSHNALQINNHFSSLYSLRHFRGEPLELFIPLSYGSFGVNGQHGGRNYLDKVKKISRRDFEKVRILDKSLPLERYLKYLWTIDVAVFDSNRPIGLANIHYLLRMGKKVFLPGDSPQYRLYKAKGVRVFDSRLIPFMSFEEFAEPVGEVDPTGFIAEKFEPGKAILKWGALFAEIERSIGAKRS